MGSIIERMMDPIRPCLRNEFGSITALLFKRMEESLQIRDAVAVEGETFVDPCPSVTLCISHVSTPYIDNPVLAGRYKLCTA